MPRPHSWLPDGVRLGVAPICWTNDVLTDLGDEIALETCLEEAAAAGYEGIELGRKFPRDAATLRPLLERQGLDLVSGWYSGLLADRDVDEEWAAVQSHLALLKALGAKVMVYGECGRMPGSAPLDEPLSRTPVLAPDEMPGYARRVTALAERLQDQGMRLAFHPHLMMAIEHGPEIDAFMAEVGPAVGLLLDTGHATAAGVDYRDLIAKYGSRIIHIHLKAVRRKVLDELLAKDLSFNEGVRRGMFTVPGDGDLNLQSIADFVRGAGYRGWLVVEAEQPPEPIPPRTYVNKAREHLARLFGGGGR